MGFAFGWSILASFMDVGICMHEGGDVDGGVVWLGDAFNFKIIAKVVNPDFSVTYLLAYTPTIFAMDVCPTVSSYKILLFIWYWQLLRGLSECSKFGVFRMFANIQTCDLDKRSKFSRDKRLKDMSRNM